MLYRNSLAPGASVSPDISLGHSSFGIVVNANVIIGERVKIHHNVTLTLRTGGAPVKLTIEDDVKIGANAVIIGPRGRSLRIGRGARIGAGTVVTHDVPAGATVVSAPPRVLLKGARDSDPDAREQAAQAPRAEEALRTEETPRSPPAPRPPPARADAPIDARAIPGRARAGADARRRPDARWLANARWLAYAARASPMARERPLARLRPMARERPMARGRLTATTDRAARAARLRRAPRRRGARP